MPPALTVRVHPSCRTWRTGKAPHVPGRGHRQGAPLALVEAVFLAPNVAFVPERRDGTVADIAVKSARIARHTSTKALCMHIAVLSCDAIDDYTLPVEFVAGHPDRATAGRR